MNTSLKATLIAAAIASLPVGVHAAGLGQINVLSGLGQPLQAEIQLSASEHELQSLLARIPPPDAFRQANVPYSSIMPGLRVEVERRGNRSVLKITSDRPVNEPFVDMLVELNWAAGRLVREYTFLLDPVDTGTPARDAAVATAPVVTSAPTQVAVTSAAQPAAPAADQGGSHTVRRGDTLRRIAEVHRPADATLDQMLMALFRENPQAFDGGNMNRLKSGAVLTIPDAASVSSISAAEARREILAQSADFDAYRRRLAGAVTGRDVSEAEAQQESSGLIVPKVADAAPAAAKRDQVRVSRTEDGEGGGDQRARLQSLEEEIVARDRALAEANSRVAELENSIRELQQLIELKNQSLAQLQQQATPAKADAGGAGAPAPAVVAEAPKAEDKPKSEAAPADIPKAEATKPEGEAAVTEKPAPKPRKPKAAPPPPPPPEPSFVESMLQDPMMLGAGGGILALLLGLVGFKVYKRRKGSATPEESVGALSEFPPATNSVFGTTGGQSVDTTNSSVLHTDFSQASLSAIDADEGVDPVAEADVYMAYGRDAQAEEILLDARKADPERAAIYLKLLEIYAQRKNLQQFETTASELYARTGGHGADWDKAAAMGRKLDPENPLYQGGPITEQAGGGLPGLGAAAVGAVAVAAGAEEAAAADAPLADLDFTNLSSGGDGGAFSEPKNPFADVASGKPAPAVEEPLPQVEGGGGLEFALDLNSAPVAEAEPLKLDEMPAQEPVAEAPAPAGDLMIDLDIDSPASSKGSADQAFTATAVGDELNLASLGEGLDFDLSIAEPSPSAAADTFDLSATMVRPEAFVEEQTTAAELDKPAFDSNLLDFDLDLEASAVTASEALDVEAAPAAVPQAAPMQAAAAVEAVGSPVLEFSGEVEPGDLREEVDTKLELARAYEEMGDKEGARELLEEVLQEGSPEQQAQARSLMQRLA